MAARAAGATGASDTRSSSPGSRLTGISNVPTERTSVGWLSQGVRFSCATNHPGGTSTWMPPTLDIVAGGDALGTSVTLFGSGCQLGQQTSPETPGRAWRERVFTSTRKMPSLFEPVTEAVLTIDVPSGDQAGSSEPNSESCVSRTMSVPSLFMVYSPGPSRSPAKAMCSPSGDHAGAPLNPPGSLVRRVTSLPSGSIT